MASSPFIASGSSFKRGCASHKKKSAHGHGQARGRSHEAKVPGSFRQSHHHPGHEGPLGEVSCLASHSSHGSGASDSSSSGGTSSAGSHTTSRRTSSKTSSGSRSCSPGRSNAAAAKHT